MKNKFLIEKNIVNKIKISNFEYFKLYIYNLKYSKLDILKNNKKKKTFLIKTFINNQTNIFINSKNLQLNVLLKFIKFNILNVSFLSLKKSQTFKMLNLINFNKTFNCKFLLMIYPTILESLNLKQKIFNYFYNFYSTQKFLKNEINKFKQKLTYLESKQDLDKNYFENKKKFLNYYLIYFLNYPFKFFKSYNYNFINSIKSLKNKKKIKYIQDYDNDYDYDDNNSYGPKISNNILELFLSKVNGESIKFSSKRILYKFSKKRIIKVIESYFNNIKYKFFNLKKKKNLITLYYCNFQTHIEYNLIQKSLFLLIIYQNFFKNLSFKKNFFNKKLTYNQLKKKNLFSQEKFKFKRFKSRDFKRLFSYKIFFFMSFLVQIKKNIYIQQYPKFFKKFKSMKSLSFIKNFLKILNSTTQYSFFSKICKSKFKFLFPIYPDLKLFQKIIIDNDVAWDIYYGRYNFQYLEKKNINSITFFLEYILNYHSINVAWFPIFLYISKKINNNTIIEIISEKVKLKKNKKQTIKQLYQTKNITINLINFLKKLTIKQLFNLNKKFRFFLKKNIINNELYIDFQNTVLENYKIDPFFLETNKLQNTLMVINKNKFKKSKLKKTNNNIINSKFKSYNNKDSSINTSNLSFLKKKVNN